MNDLQLGRYRHYKGKLYIVKGIAKYLKTFPHGGYLILGPAKHSEILEELAIWKSLETGELFVIPMQEKSKKDYKNSHLEEFVIYKGFTSKRVWARPKKMFLEKIIISGIELPRFRYEED